MKLFGGSCQHARLQGSVRNHIPRLSAAITTPSLNFMARTEVPVTTGDCVC